MGIFFKVLKYTVLGFLVSSILAVIAYRWMPVSLTPLMVIRCVQHGLKGEPMAVHHKWVPLKQISPYLPVAVMASEDQNFMHHHGFDFNAIQSAAIEHIEGGRSRGGSTISQQTAKNVFLWPTSSWVRKGFEAYFTVLIEFFWSKDRIMEVYLNSIEMGPNIYGAEAVASVTLAARPANCVGQIALWWQPHCPILLSLVRCLHQVICASDRRI